MYEYSQVARHHSFSSTYCTASWVGGGRGIALKGSAARCNSGLCDREDGAAVGCVTVRMVQLCDSKDREDGSDGWRQVSNKTRHTYVHKQ